MCKYQKLVDILHENGFDYNFMSKYLGVSHVTWYHRIHGRRDWKTSEIRKISDLLDLTPAETSEYFLLNGCI